MKETIQDLLSRRSCRKFLPQQIEESQLQTILEAGTYAPTGKGAQSPLIVVVQKPELLGRISRLNAAVMQRDDLDPFYGAPTLLIVFADSRVATYRDDGALVMGNLLNAAHAVGVDSCFIYRAREVFRTPEGQALMAQWKIPDYYEGIGNCILGYGAEGGVKAAAPRKDGYVIRT